jgi:hypothetical protein
MAGSIGCVINLEAFLQPFIDCPAETVGLHIIGTGVPGERSQTHGRGEGALGSPMADTNQGHLPLTILGLELPLRVWANVDEGTGTSR